MAERVEVVVAGRDEPSGRNDVVVVDAGTVGRDECFERLRRCAASDARIGTVVPWSARTLAPQETDVGVVSAALDRAGPQVYPDFIDDRATCIYVSSRALRDAGGVDVLRDRASLQSRVRAAGYRNVLCDDAYAGTYMTELPLHGAPRALAPIARLARTQIAIETTPTKPGILHVLHSRGGGTEKYVQSVVGASRAQFRHYFLRVAPGRWLFKDAIGEHGAACEWPRAAPSEDCLRIMCRWLAVDFVHVHSLVGSGDDLVRMLAATGLPYGYSVHDMYAPCPTVYLIDASGRYCNATTDLSTCAQCLAQVPAFRDVDIGRWRARYAGLLRGAAKVFAPSHWAGETLRKYYPGADIEVRPHPVQVEDARRPDVFAFELPDDGFRHVAVLGAIGPEKGARNIDALADEIRKRSLPLRIVVVGFTDRARRWQSDDRTLTIHGSYGPDELGALLDRYRIDVVVFPTIWPETFSYTLSEAWHAGRPALVPPRGALAERVQATGAGWLMRGWPDMAAVADELAGITSGARAAELSERSHLARTAAEAEASDGVGAPYEGVVRAATPAAADHATLHEIYVAACRAMSVEPEPVLSSIPSRVSVLQRIAQLGKRG